MPCTCLRTDAPRRGSTQAPDADHHDLDVHIDQQQKPLKPPIASPLCCWCQVVGRLFFEVGSCCAGVPAVVPGRMVVSGPGVAGPKSWRSGCELAALEAESFPGCLPGPLVLAAVAWRASAWRRAKMASLILRLRDLSASLQVFPSVTFLLVGAALAVLVPELGYRGHMDRVVDTPVAAQGQPVDLPVPGGHFDRCSAVIGGEVIAPGKPGSRRRRRR